MRPDATKVYTEAGKRGYKLHGPRMHNIRLEDADDLPTHEGIKGGKGWGDKYHRTKRTDEKWGYIKRFLMSRVGRPWDEVFSEICAEADKRTWTGHHLRDQLDFYVERNCFIRDGKVFNEHGHEIGGWWNAFYVHPESKTLELQKRKRWHPKKDPQKVFELKDKQYFKWDDIWYRVKFETAAKIKKWGWYDYVVPRSLDVFLKDQISHYPYWNSWAPVHLLRQTYGSENGEIRYCVWKQAANGREIEQLKKLYGDKLP